MSQPNILITGATGTIGSALIAELEQHGIAARAGVRTIPDVPPDGITQYVPFDFAQPAMMDSALRGVRTLFLLTPNTGEAIDYARTAIAAARMAGVSHIIRLSAYSDPDEIYNPHRITDELVVESGMAYTLLQPIPFMQNFVSAFGATIRSQSALYEPLGDARVSYIDARDVARAAAAVLSDPAAHAGQAYHLTGPDALSDYDIVRILSDVTGRAIQYVNIPEEAARASLVGIGLPASVVETVIGLYGLMRAGKRESVTQHVEAITGQPATPFAVFARDYAAAFTA
ncbi:MAG: NmrA family NAD(P)-binding protein [Chloroflexi bacterium]|uniref:NmrA family NAD(P)-binding protein n=1 Tax=Candidatus Flexifilum breve TaxID=3140694 RepID=UPI003135C733|nr:NmrA family NAD(P)-binding protein [Chloroflexota bacterium]